MASFSFNGADTLSASFEDMANLTDSERMSVIMPGAKLLMERQRSKILTLFNRRTGALADSLDIQERSDENGAYAHIYLKGKHPRSGIGKRLKKGKSSGRYSGTNAEVGYILEYGSPRIAASHWMETANEESSDDVAAAQQEAWNDLIEKKGL